jgi:hypothetical protein
MSEWAYTVKLQNNIHSKHAQSNKNMQRIQHQRETRKRQKEKQRKAQHERRTVQLQQQALDRKKKERALMKKLGITPEMDKTRRLDRERSERLNRGIAPSKSVPAMSIPVMSIAPTAPTTSIEPTQSARQAYKTFIQGAEAPTLRQSFSSNQGIEDITKSFASSNQDWEDTTLELSQDMEKTLEDKTEEAIKRSYEPKWKVREEAKQEKARVDRQNMLKRELGSLPKHQLAIINGFPNYPWNNYPYRADAETGFSLWPLQGMQGQKTPIRNAPFATASNERDWKDWKTLKDDMFDPVRDGRALPAKSMKDICSPYRADSA